MLGALAWSLFIVALGIIEGSYCTIAMYVLISLMVSLVYFGFLETERLVLKDASRAIENRQRVILTKSMIEMIFFWINFRHIANPALVFTELMLISVVVMIETVPREVLLMLFNNSNTWCWNY